MKLFSRILFSILVFSQSLSAQGIKQTSDSSNVTIFVKNPINHDYLSDFQLKIVSSRDSNTFTINSAKNIYFELDTNEFYQISVVKENFDTANFNFEYRSTRELILIEVYLPPTNLTKKDRRLAHKEANKLPYFPLCNWCGGFKKMKLARNQFWLYKINILHLDGSMTKSYSSY